LLVSCGVEAFLQTILNVIFDSMSEAADIFMLFKIQLSREIKHDQVTPITYRNISVFRPFFQ
jgi:hypothetical protein